MKKTTKGAKTERKVADLSGRKHTLFTSTISGEVAGVPTLLGVPLSEMAQSDSLAAMVGGLFLGRRLKSKLTIECIDLILKLSVDHGPNVSGAVNTMIAARAGRDMVSSLIAGLATIGARFGGATNEAARIWFTAVKDGAKPYDVVEGYAKRKQRISGIGHKRYRIDDPDPRVSILLTHLGKQIDLPHLAMALQVEAITTKKSPNLILNIDGAIGAVMVDLLMQEEGCTAEQITQLIESEFFNAFFVFARSAGLIGHYLDQKRLGEPLFRLPEEDVLIVSADE